MTSKKWLLNFIQINFFILLITILFFEVILYSFKENISSKKIYNMQKNNPEILVGRKFISSEFKLKTYIPNIIKPNLIFIGSSNFMQIDQTFFDNSFYNSSINTIALNEILIFLKKINYKPKAIFIGLDPWQFNQNFHTNKKNILIKKLRKNEFFYLINFLIKKIMKRPAYYRMLLNEDLNLKKVLDKNYNSEIGINANIYKTGFKSDGSYKYNNKYEKKYDKKTINEHILSLNSKERFIKTNKLDIYAIKLLEDIILLAYRKDIPLFFVINPVSPNFYLALKSNNNVSNFITKYEEDLCRIIQQVKKNNQILICLNLFNSKKTLDANDFDFYDSIHPKKSILLKYFKNNKEIESILK